MLGLKDVEEFKVGAVDSAAKAESTWAGPFEAYGADTRPSACEDNVVVGSRTDDHFDRGLCCMDLAGHRNGTSNDVLDVYEDEATIKRAFACVHCIVHSVCESDLDSIGVTIRS